VKAQGCLRRVGTPFILMEKIVDGVKEGDPAGDDPREEARPDRAPREPKRAAAPGKSGKLAPAEIVPMVLKAMNALDPEGEWYNLSQLGQYITRANPDFDPRTYGKTKLSDVMTATGRFEVRKAAGNQTEVRRTD